MTHEMIFPLLFCILFITMCVADRCDLWKAVGEQVIVPLKKSVQATDHITWIHGSSRVFHRRGANVKEERFKVTKNSSLLLENIQASLAGDYTVKIYDDEGNLVFHNSQKLCVIEAVSNTCEAVWPTLGCTVGGPAADAADAAVSWHRNGILLPGFESKTLPLKPRMFNHGDWYTCTVENVISNKVQPQQCSAGPPTTNPKKQELELWGLNKWLMVGLLSGGGALVLVLIIVCIICICSHCRRRKERDSDEEELRLANLTQPDSHTGQQRPQIKIQNLPQNQFQTQTQSQTQPRRPRRERGPLPEIPTQRGPAQVKPSPKPAKVKQIELYAHLK